MLFVITTYWKGEVYIAFEKLWVRYHNE